MPPATSHNRYRDRIIRIEAFDSLTFSLYQLCRHLRMVYGGKAIVVVVVLAWTGTYGDLGEVLPSETQRGAEIINQVLKTPDEINL